MFLTLRKQNQLKKEMKKLRKEAEDLNIEFRNHKGSGISLVKKQYPDLVLDGDIRTGLVEKKNEEN